MSLQKQFISIPLGVGLDTKPDDKQLQPGKLRALENGVFTKVGRVELRSGLKSLENKVIGTTAGISALRGLSSFRAEINAIGDSAFYAYSAGSRGFLNKGPFYSASVQSTSVIRNLYEQTSPDCAIGAGYVVYAWEDSTGGVRASVFDQTSNQPVLVNFLISATASRPKCVANGSYLYVFYVDTGNTVHSRRFSIQNLTTFETDQLVGSGLSPSGNSPFFDIAPWGANFVLAYSIPTGIKVGFIKQTGVFAGAVDGFAVPKNVSLFSDNCLGVLTFFNNDPANDGIYLFYHDAVSGLCAGFLNAGLTNTPTQVVLDSFGGAVTRQVGAVAVTSSLISVIYEIDASDPGNRYVKSTTFTRAGVAGTPKVVLKGVGLHSKPFTYNSESYFVACYSTPLQACYFTVHSSGFLINRISYQNGGGVHLNRSTLPNVPQSTATTFICPTEVKGPLRSEGGKLFTLKGIQSTQIDFQSAKLFMSKELGANAFIAGGMLFSYDGNAITEHGFNVYPEPIVVVPSGSAGSYPAGTRSYTAIYEWTDQQGQVHRSFPAVPVSYVAPGTALAPQIRVPTLRLTSKSNVSIVLYATLNNAGSNASYYRLTSVTTPLLNDKTTDSVLIDGTAVDSTIASHELLYTAGGILENSAPPSSSVLEVYGNRLFLAGCEDPNEYRYSKTYTQGQGVGFNDVFVGRIDDGTPGINALGVLDEKLVLFKREAIYVTTGLGPLDTGAQNDFQTPQRLPLDAGCVEPKSVISFRDGLIFKTTGKGWYKLDRSLMLSYIGSPVEDFNGLTVSGAQLLANSNQVRLTHTDGSALVYDYFFNQWSTFKNYNCVASRVVGSTYVLARSTGNVDLETSTTYLDNGAAVSLKLLTPWISLSGFQGFQRIYRAIFACERKSDHVLVVRVGYNFEHHFRETFTINTADILGTDYFGKDGYFGQSAAFGGVKDPVEQFEVKPMIQKCQSIRFEITSLNPEAIDGAGFSISAVGIEFGAKQGGNRVDSVKSMGSL